MASRVSRVALGSGCSVFVAGDDDESTRRSEAGEHQRYQSLPRIHQVHRIAVPGHGWGHHFQVLADVRDVLSSESWKSGPNQTTIL